MHGVAVPKTENEFHKASLNDHQWVPLVTRQGIIIFRLHNNFLNVILALKLLFCMVDKNFNLSVAGMQKRSQIIILRYEESHNIFRKKMNLQITKCFGLINFEKNPSLTFFFLFEFGTLNDHLGGNTFFVKWSPRANVAN